MIDSNANQPKIIEVRIREVYGRERIYPANPLADALAALLGRKTFERFHLDQFRSLGYEIKSIAANLD